MRELEEPGTPEEVVGSAVAFAVFVLSHAACGEAVFEARLGERWLLEGCTACGVMRTFVLPVR